MINYKTINLSIFLITIVCQCANREMKKGSQKTEDSSSNETQGAIANKSEEILQSKKTLVLQGIFDSSGNALVKIEKPALYDRKLSRPTPDQREGRYVILITYSDADSLKVYFDALVAGDRDDRARHGFFEIQVPVKDQKIRSIKIIESASRKLHKEFKDDDIIQK